ncbi:hypothetical protein [Halorubrum trueperi]|uniref:DUF8060 domain-containing protein n=1 Tax=Halorubrum trueperi TaxID=2004704 RepID=A0ABD5UHI1_9EURY
MTDDRDDVGEEDRNERARTETDDAPTTRTMTDTATDGGERTDSTTDGGDRADSTTDDGNRADSTTDGDGGPSGVEFDRLTTDRLRGILDRVGLAALVLLALIAGWSFYSQTGTAIRTWLDPAYQPLALAAFNLAVLLVALAGVAHQLARIRTSESGSSGSEYGGSEE